MTGVQFMAGAIMGSFLFATPPKQWVTWVLSPEVKRPGREADHLLASRDKVKNT